MRKKLTLQELELLNTASAYNGAQHNEICGKATLELIEYKKIEQELGIDFITLFKALKNGIYVKDLKGKIHFVRPHLRMVTNTHLGLEFQCPIKWRYIQLPEDGKNYGKTWALTREELLCQQ